MLVVCEAGGHVAIMVKAGIWKNDIHPYFRTLARNGKVRILNRIESYVSMPVDPNTILSLAIVIDKS